MAKVEYRMTRQKVGCWGLGQEWAKRDFPELVADFERLLYENEDKNRKLIQRFLNKDGNKGISLQFIIKFMQQNGYKVQILTWNISKK